MVKTPSFLVPMENYVELITSVRESQLALAFRWPFVVRREILKLVLSTMDSNFETNHREVRWNRDIFEGEIPKEIEDMLEQTMIDIVNITKPHLIDQRPPLDNQVLAISELMRGELRHEYWTANIRKVSSGNAEVSAYEH